MKTHAARHPAKLEDLPNIGPRIADHLRTIGITTPAALRKRTPLTVFNDLRKPMGRKHDPCVLYTLLAVKHLFETSESLPWWNFTGEGKAQLAKR
jgi:DNA transformation protein